MEVPTSKARGITARLNLMGCVDFTAGEVQYREIEGNTTGQDTKNFIETLAKQAVVLQKILQAALRDSATSRSLAQGQSYPIAE